MRNRRAVPLVLLLGLVGCGRSPVGVVDIDRVFKEYSASKKIYEEIQERKKDLETRGQEMLDEINRLVKESELLSDEARKEREARIKEKSRALEEFRRSATLGLMERTNKEYGKVLDDVRSAARAVAARRGLAIVMDASVVVYNSDRIDVTADIIAELNRRCAVKSGRGAS